MKMRMKAKEMQRMGQLSRPRLLEEQSEGRDLWLIEQFTGHANSDLTLQWVGRPVLQRIETSASDGFYPFKGDEKGWFANHSLPPNFESESSRDVSGARCSRVAETWESDSHWSCRRLEPLGFHWRVGEGWVAVVLSRASTRSGLTSTE